MSIKAREKMMNISLYGNHINSGILYILFKSKVLDYYIKNVSSEETIINHKSANEVKILNSEEQLLELLDHFIIWFTDDFYFIGKTKMLILEIILNYHNNDEYLFFKKYLGNNDYIEYFDYTIEKLIVTGFVENIGLLKANYPRIYYTLKINEIDYQKINLESHKTVNQLYELLKKLSIANHKN